MSQATVGERNPGEDNIVRFEDVPDRLEPAS